MAGWLHPSVPGVREDIVEEGCGGGKPVTSQQPEAQGGEEGGRGQDVVPQGTAQ